MKPTRALLAILSGGRINTVSVARTVVEVGRAVRSAMAYFSSFTGFLFFGDTFGGVVGLRSGTHPDPTQRARSTTPRSTTGRDLSAVVEVGHLHSVRAHTLGGCDAVCVVDPLRIG